MRRGKGYAIDHGDNPQKKKPLNVVRAQKKLVIGLKRAVYEAKKALNELEARHNKQALKLIDICPHPEDQITSSGFDYIHEVCRLCGKSVWL